MESRGYGVAFCIALALISSVSSATHPYFSFLPGAYNPYFRLQSQQPIYYIPDASSRIATPGSPSEPASALKHLAPTHPEALSSQRYVVTPYLTPAGFYPFPHSQVTSLDPQGYNANNKYFLVPAGTNFLGKENQRQSAWQNFLNFINSLRPGNHENPKPDESPQGPTNSENTGGPQGPPDNSNEESYEQPSPVVAEPDAEMVESPNMEGAEAAEASEIKNRHIARFRAFGREGEETGEGNGEGTEEGTEEGTGGGTGEEVIEEEEEKEEEENDTVVIGPGGTNPSVAQAKPAAIALAGIGGVAAAAPTATAVVGANGLAVAAPSATAISGPTSGAPAPGLLPKGTRIRSSKISPEEARINAAKIQAARESAYRMAAGLGYGGFPSLSYYLGSRV